MEKVDRLTVGLREERPYYFEGLQMVLLEGVRPITKVRRPDGRVQDMLMLGSNAFLNLNFHPRVVEAQQKAVEKYGTGAGSPPLYSGQTDLHEELEARIAQFLGTEAAIVFSAGYAGNVGVLTALCRPGNLLFADSSNHASLVDGARLSGADIVPYLHLSAKHLELCLRNADPNKKGRIIVSDGVFSMEGSLAPVDELVRLKKEYGCLLMIDDAHGYWAVGERGQGTASLFGQKDQVDICYGTFSKALGSVGGFCGAKKSVIEYLRLYARSHFFSSALPAVTVAAILETINVVEQEPEHLERLKRNRDFFQNRLESAGFNTLNSRSAIVPIMTGDDEKLGLVQMEMFDCGIFSNIGTTPAVNAKKSRLRLNVMATHSLEQLDEAAGTIERIARKYDVLPTK